MSKASFWQIPAQRPVLFRLTLHHWDNKASLGLSTISGLKTDGLENGTFLIGKIRIRDFACSGKDLSGNLRENNSGKCESGNHRSALRMTAPRRSSNDSNFFLSPILTQLNIVKTNSRQKGLKVVDETVS